MKAPTDEELLLAAGRGDREAFALLVRRHHRAIIHFVHRFLATADRATAEDLAQQVFLSAWRYAPGFEPRAQVRTWLFRIATNACLNYRRGQRSRPGAVPLTQAAEAPDAADSNGVRPLLEQERARQVRLAVAALPPAQRAAIVLRYFHDFPVAQIAAVLGVSVSAAEALLHRGREGLYRRLGEAENAAGPQVSPRPRAEVI